MDSNSQIETSNAKNTDNLPSINEGKNLNYSQLILCAVVYWDFWRYGSYDLLLRARNYDSWYVAYLTRNNRALFSKLVTYK